MASVAAGLVGGLLGAVAGGVVLLLASDDPDPATVVWAKYLGDGNPERYRRRGVAVHLVYGALAGAVFVPVARALALGLSSLGGALLWAVVWSALLAVVAVGFWLHVVVGDRPDAEGLAALGGMHLAYGLGLGVVLALVPGL